MIIKKNSQKFREGRSSNVDKQVLKPQDFAVSSKNDVPIEEFQEEKEQDLVVQKTIEQPAVEKPVEPEIDLFDIENIDFEQREERRRGSRRRGYRRIDDRNLVSRAQEEADVIKKSAFEEGYQEGIEQAQEDLAAFRNNLKQFMNTSKDVFEYIAPDILEISIDIARKVVKKELDTDPQVLINTIVDVLKSVSKSEPKINIRVKPQDVQFVKDTIPNITYQYGIDAKINIVADPSLVEGGCIFQTNNGIVDASIDTQLEIIKKALEGI